MNSSCWQARHGLPDSPVWHRAALRANDGRPVHAKNKVRLQALSAMNALTPPWAPRGVAQSGQPLAWAGVALSAFLSRPLFRLNSLGRRHMPNAHQPWCAARKVHSPTVSPFDVALAMMGLGLWRPLPMSDIANRAVALPRILALDGANRELQPPNGNDSPPKRGAKCPALPSPRRAQTRRHAARAPPVMSPRKEWGHKRPGGSQILTGQQTHLVR